MLQKSMCGQGGEAMEIASTHRSKKETINSLVSNVPLQLFTIFLRLSPGIFFPDLIITSQDALGLGLCFLLLLL